MKDNFQVITHQGLFNDFQDPGEILDALSEMDDLYSWEESNCVIGNH